MRGRGFERGGRGFFSGSRGNHFSRSSGSTGNYSRREQNRGGTSGIINIDLCVCVCVCVCEIYIFSTRIILLDVCLYIFTSVL